MRRAYQHQLTGGLCAVALLQLLVGGVVRADIYQWEYIDPSDPSLGKQQSAMLAPGGAGVDAVPGADLRQRDFTMAYLIDIDLHDADFYRAKLTDADLSQSNLVGASFSQSTLTGAVFTGAQVQGADFENTQGLTAAQLYSTGSYQAQDLSGISLSNNDLSGWNFANQNLAGASIRSLVTGANFAGAQIQGADFGSATDGGFTATQLYSTASYQARELVGVSLYTNDASGWNFADQNLTGASFRSTTLTGADFSHANLTGVNFNYATLTDADFTGAEVQDADFSDTTASGFTADQLYSTASYQARDLRGINLGAHDVGVSILRGWNFAGQNLTDADFSYAILTETDFTGAEIKGADFSVTSHGFGAAQLYSTASYQALDLSGIGLENKDLGDWSFAGQNLTNANFLRSYLSGANMTGADTRGGRIDYYLNVVVTNMIRPDGRITGMTLGQANQLLIRDYDGNALTGSPAIPIQVDDHFQITSTGKLRLIFEADPWDSTISFEAGIPVTLGGTLALTFAGDVDLATQVGRTLKLFDWTGVSPTGEFAVWSPHLWDTSSLYTTGEVTFLAAADPNLLAGDYNADGVVDAADYVVWRNSVGAPAGTLPNDVDGVPIGMAQYATWKGNYRNTLAGVVAASDATVPEPATWVIAGVMLSLLLPRCKAIAA